MDFWRWLIDLLSIKEKLDKKTPSPNLSSMEAINEPVNDKVSVTIEKVIRVNKKVYTSGSSSGPTVQTKKLIPVCSRKTR